MKDPIRRRRGTFLLNIYDRQNSTWQGELFWMERGEKQNFSSTLDLINIIDGDLTFTEIETSTMDDYVVGK